MDRPFKKDRSIFLFRQVRPRFPAVSTITLCSSYNLMVKTYLLALLGQVTNFLSLES